MPLRDIGRKELRRRALSRGKIGEEARKRDRRAGRAARLGRVEIGAADRDARRKLQPCALAAGGVAVLELGEGQAPFGRDLLEARVEHRLDRAGGQRKRRDRAPHRERRRAPRGFALTVAKHRLPPPREADLREPRVARAKQRLADLMVERGEGEERVAAGCGRVERGEPLVSRMAPRDRRACR